MSNNPFQTDPPQSNFDPNAGYADQTPKKSGGATPWLIGCGVAGLLGVLICCGGGYFLTKAGMGVFSGEFRRMVADDPAVVEHIGEIQSFEVSFGQTAQATEGNQDGQPTLAFDVVGDKGKGVVLIRDNPGTPQPDVLSGELVLPDGQRFDLQASTGDPADDLDMDDISIEMGDDAAEGSDTVEETDAESESGEPSAIEPIQVN